MKMRNLLLLSIAGLGVAANAQLTLSYNDMDQVRSEGSLVSTANFGVNQEFEAGFAAFSGQVADDVTFSGNSIDRVAIAMEFTDPASISGFMNRAQGWIVRVGSAAQMAAGTASATTVGLGTTLMGSGNVGGVSNSRTFEITGLNIAVSGSAMVSVVPVMDFAVGGQTFILSNNAPLLGGGNNSQGFNPGNGFGLGTQIPVLTNAAISVNTVPEPASMIALASGLVALARRRRNK